MLDVSDQDDIHADVPLHIKVPFPLLIADIATGFIPDEAFEGLADALPPVLVCFVEHSGDQLQSLHHDREAGERIR